MKRIGIFGGSFNPTHKLHKEIAEYLIQQEIVDKIIFVPTGNGYPKKELIPLKYRIKMLEMEFGKDMHYEISDFEDQKSCVYTYQTLDHFHSLYPDSKIYFIMGTDNLNEIDTWQRYSYLLENYFFIVVKRDGYDSTQMEEKLEQYKSHFLFVEVPFNQVSSTRIRENLRNGESVEKELSKSVLNYIKTEKLYL